MATVSLPRSSPESMGVHSSGLLAFIDGVEAERLDLHSLMVLRRGNVIAEGWWAPYGPNDIHLLYSLSKSFTSTAIGMAVGEGLLSVDDPVASFFAEDVPPDASENLLEMRVRHLLSMSAGQDSDDLLAFYTRSDGNWIAGFLEREAPFAPGSQFMYNSGATYALSAILQKLTGETVLEYLRPRLLDPIGAGPATWETDPRGINVGGWGMSVTTETIARFGQFLLQKGEWNGEQLVSADWIEEATRSHISNGDDPNNDWNQGYGYQFWRCRHGAYRGDGAFGQYCIVMPDQEMVVAITGSVGDMGAVLRLVWDHILGSAVPGELPVSDAPLAARLACLDARSPAGALKTKYEEEISSAVYRNSRGDTMRMEIGEDFVEWFDSRRSFPLKIGVGAWIEGEMDLEGFGPQRMSARGAWVDDVMFAAEFRAVESPYAVGATISFGSDGLVSRFTPRGRFGALDTREFEGGRV